MTPEPSAMSYDHEDKTQEELGREGEETSTTPSKKSTKPKIRTISTRKPAKAKAKAKPKKTEAPKVKKTAPKKTAKTRARKDSGTRRTNGKGIEFHVMSVHIPITLLAKLDRKVAALVRAGKRSSRSQFAIQAISSKL